MGQRNRHVSELYMPFSPVEALAHRSPPGRTFFRDLFGRSSAQNGEGSTPLLDEGGTKVQDIVVEENLGDEGLRGGDQRASMSRESDSGGLIQGVFDLTLNTAGSLIKFAINTLGADDPPPPPEDE